MRPASLRSVYPGAPTLPSPASGGGLGWGSLVALDRQSAGGDAGRVEALGEIRVCLQNDVVPRSPASWEGDVINPASLSRRVLWARRQH